ncbi:MAG: CPBP family intramembrane metalloprotease [Planctomycetia bacterium]|nr:CPBP family intramembrane metalloprotease [Planctomycetia bacterium]
MLRVRLESLTYVSGDNVPQPWNNFEPLLPYLTVAAAVLPVLLVLGWWQRHENAALFPPRRQRATPWTGAEVLGAFLIAQLVPVAFLVLLQRTALLDLLYTGPRPPQKLYDLRCGLWAATLALPLLVAAILLQLRAISHTRPYQVGWTGHRLPGNILLGLLYWLALTPAILLLHVFVTHVYDAVLHSPPDEHPIPRLLHEAGAPADWLLTVLSAAIAAPVGEELLYRGVLQPWLMRRVYRCDLVFILSLLLAVLFREKGLTEAVVERDAWQFFLELQPAMFVLLLLPAQVFLRSRPSLTSCAILNSALFFAVWHTGVWPTPIPLLCLGLLLGYLSWRTQSLVAPIVLHAVFNSVAIVTMVLLKT